MGANGTARAGWAECVDMHAWVPQAIRMGMLMTESVVVF